MSVDVSDKWIPIRGGVFIGMEWVADSNSKTEFEFQDPQGWHFCGSRQHNEGIHNGQVLGTTWDYGVLSWTFARDHSHDYEWKHRYTLYTQEEYRNVLSNTYAHLREEYLGGDPIHHWFNPMIYATYTYSKK